MPRLEQAESGRTGDMRPRAVRRSRGSRTSAVSLAVGLALSLGLVAAPGAGADDDLDSKKAHIDAKVDDAHDEVLAFNKKVAHATNKVIDARAQLPGARANLEKALAEKTRTEAADAAAAQELEEATQEVLLAEERLSRLEGRLDELRAHVGDFARRAYQMGPFAEVEMVLDARDPADFTDRLAAIRSVSESNNQTLVEMTTSRADLAYTETRLSALRDVATQKKEAAEARLAEAKEAAEGAAAAKAIVDNLIKQERAALASAKKHAADVKAEYDRLADEQERIQAEIRAAARALERSTGVNTNGDANVIDNGKEWYFPVPGYAIGSDAGWRFHPILHYTRCHAGADIGAPSGTPIHAVDDGVVLSAGYNGGYGNFTLIGHGDRLTSGYGHQSRIIVSSGQHVDRGDVIGFVGSTGLSTGPHLHFEARVDGLPYSPKGWFGQGPKIQVCV